MTRMASLFDLVLFTAAEKQYAEAMRRLLDPGGLVKMLLWRDHCTKIGGKVAKLKQGPHQRPPPH